MTNPQEYFVLTLPLKTEQWQKDCLDKRMEVNRQIYNALLNETLKRFRQMSQTKRYRGLVEELDAQRDPKERKRILKLMDGMVEEFRLRKFDITKEAAKYRKYFKENTDSPIVQNLAVNAWKAVDRLMRRQSGTVYFKKAGELNTLSGKTNISSIMYKDGIVCWKGLKIPVHIKKENIYEQEALQHEIRYCRIKRQKIRGKYKYYVDLIMKGSCPSKVKTSFENKMNKVGAEATDKRVGLDIGLRHLAVVADEKVEIYNLPTMSEKLERQKNRIAKKMERSRRLNNPQNYNENGTIKKGHHFFKESGNYTKLKNEYQECCRRQKIKRSEQQQKLVEQILAYGTLFYVEDLDYRKMKSRYGTQLYRRNGSYRKRQNYGKVIQMTAPATFLQYLERKLIQNRGELYKVNPVKAKAASLNHLTGETENVSLRRKKRRIGKITVNKYLYSAFLLQHIEQDTETVNIETCKKDFFAFIENYELYQTDRGLVKAG